MVWLECGILLAVALITTIALTPVAKALATRFDAIDYPDKRRVNTKPIPRMGGIALFGGIIASCMALIIGVNLFGWINPIGVMLGKSVDVILLSAGIIIMFGIGAIDDVINMRARYKLLGQTVAACFVAASGLVLSSIQNPFIEGALIDFGLLSYPITVFYLVAFANIINLIDGLDGLAAGISAISAATIFCYSMMSGKYEVALVSSVVIGICLGFLKSNHHPASIFMGDSGSLLLGLMLGVISLMGMARSTLVVSLLVPIVVAAVPITDTAMAIIRRTRGHQAVGAPDKGHIHHRLLEAGYSQRATVYIMWGWTAAMGICSLVLAESDGFIRIAAIIIAALITGFGIAKLRLFEPVLRHHYNPRKTNKQK